MKVIRCRDLGFDCNFIATGSASESNAVKEKMLEHIKTEHSERIDEEELKDIESKVETLLSRGCGCGAL